MPKKKNNWKRSYKAHLRCSALGSYDKWNYHQACAKRIRQLKRKLTKKEKESFWNWRFSY